MKIEALRRYLQSDPHAINFNTAVNYAANVYHSAAGLFWSNAPSYSSLVGRFETTLISTPFGLGVEIDKSGPTYVVSVTYGKSWGAGIFHLTTNTPKWTTWDTKCSKHHPILI